jgi:RHS repeat-associated protein
MPIVLLPSNLLTAPDEPRHIPRSPGHLPYHSWGSGATVNAHSGELVVEEVDLEVAGRGIDFAVTRRYRSGITYTGPFGRNWEADINPRLVEISAAMAPDYGAALGLTMAAGDVLRMDGTGRVDVYKRQPDGSYLRPDGFYTGLTRATEGSYGERDRSGSLATYAAPAADGIATLSSVTDRHGNTLRFTYDAGRITPTTVVDTLGRTITFEYDGSNRITAVADFAGRRWTYAYDEHGDLITATSPSVTGTAHGNDFPSGKTTRYAYLGASAEPLLQHNMVAITAPNEVAAGGAARTTFRYDSQDRVVSFTAGGTSAGGVPAGGEVTYAYRAVDPVGAPSTNTVLNETTVVDANGNQSIYRFNSAGNIVELSQATNRDIRSTDPAAFITRHEYSAEGQLLRTVLPEGNAIRYTYDETNPDPLQRGNLRALTRDADADRGGDQTSLTTTYAYDPIFNRVRAVTDPRGNDPAYVPPNGGVPSAARYTTTYIYDYQEGDNAALLASALGLSETDVRARLTASGVPMNLGDVNGDGRTDMVAGNLVRVDRPAVNLPADSQLAADFGPQQPSFELYGYNSHSQMRFAVDAEGNLTRYEYHPENDPDGDGRDLIAGAGTGPLGYLKAVVVDAGQNMPPVEITPRAPVSATPGLPPYATATPGAARSAGVFLPVGYKNAGVLGAAEFDGQQDRLANGMSRSEPSSSRTDSVLQTDTEPMPPAWRNLDGRRTFQNVRTEYRYDRVGHVTSVLNPRGVRTDYVVNALGQVVEERQAADVQAALNNPLEPNWPACRDLTLSECARGMVAFGFRTRYTYDANDNVVKVERENREAIDPALAGAWLTSSYSYDILDFVVAEEAAVEPGRTVRWLHRYDKNGNRVLTRSPLTQSVDGAAAAQPDHLISIVYDERDGVATVSRGGVTEQFRALAAHADIPELIALPGGTSRSTTMSRYNGNGNRVSQTDAVDNSGDGQPETTTTLYDGFDRPVSTVDGLGNQTFVQYDPAGNAVRTSIYGPVGGASPTGNGAATFGQPLTDVGFDQPLLSRSESRFDERGRGYERRDNLFSYAGVTYQRLPVLVEGSDDTPGDGWVITRIEYDRKGRPVYSVDDGGDRTHSRYDGLDRTVFTRDAEGNEAEAVFDQGGNTVRSWRTEVTRAGEVAAGSVPNLRQRFTTVRVYDALDRLIRETDDLGQTRRWRYDSLGNEVEETDAMHSTSARARIRDPLGAFPAAGMGPGTDGLINRPGNATLSYHDGLSRLVKRVFDMRSGGQGSSPLDTANPANPDGLITLVTSWDDASRVVAQTDDTGRTTRTAYDGLDRAVRQTLADGSVYEASYDLDDNLMRTSDPNRNVITITVDGLGRQVELNGAPGAGVAGATRQTWQYDGLSRARLTVDENDTANNSDDISAGLAYDSLGRTLEEIQNNLAVSSRWSGDGNRLALIYPNGRTLAYGHDDLGQIDTIHELLSEGDPILVADFDRVGPGRLLERRLANGIAWTQLSDDRSAADGYDAAGRMVRSRHIARGDAALVAGFGYGYNRDDSPRFEDKLHDSANGEMYPYDSLGRMTDYRRGRLNAAGDAVTAPSEGVMQRQTWQLDGAGNWAETSRSAAEATERELREHSPIHAVTKVGAATLTYDANGNLTDDGTRLYHWDAFNRLRRVVRKAGGAEIAIYAYDAFGRRAGKIVSNSGALDGVFRHYLDGWQEIEEHDVSGNVRRQFIYGASLDEPLAMDSDLDGDGSVTSAADQRLYFHQNAQLSVFALTDITGKPVEGYQYDPYGRPIVYTPGPNGTLDWGGDDVVTPGGASALGNTYLYTGRRFEPETGLYYYRARYMDPVLGRFISQDPLGAWGTANLGSAFAYVANMPQSAVDSMGLATTVKSSKSNSSEKVMAGKGIPGLTIGLIKPGSTPQSMGTEIVDQERLFGWVNPPSQELNDACPQMYNEGTGPIIPLLPNVPKSPPWIDNPPPGIELPPIVAPSTGNNKAPPANATNRCRCTCYRLRMTLLGNLFYKYQELDVDTNMGCRWECQRLFQNSKCHYIAAKKL